MRLATISFSVAILIANAAHAASTASSGPPPTQFLATTITDIGRPYTVINGTCVFQAFPKVAASGDPLEDAMAQAFSRVRAIAADAGANALIGYHIDFANPEGKDPGRLLLCGTLVKTR